MRNFQLTQIKTPGSLWVEAERASKSRSARLAASLVILWVTLACLPRMPLIHLERVSLGSEQGFQVYVRKGDMQIGAGLALGERSLSFGSGLTILDRAAHFGGASITRCAITLSTADDGVIADLCNRSLTRLGDLRQFGHW